MPRRAAPLTGGQPPVPRSGWVETCLPVQQRDVNELGFHNALPGPGAQGRCAIPGRDRGVRPADPRTDRGRPPFLKETLRYYERRGLLDEPERGPGGPRLYDGGAVRTPRVVKAVQRLLPVALRRDRFQEDRDMSGLHGPRDFGLVRGDTRPASDRRGEGRLRAPLRVSSRSLGPQPHRGVTG
ncbi:hypothetical protein GCM10009642_05600 [Nocardiopsis metallicus]